MLEAEKKHKRDAQMFANGRHPTVTPMIRSMLLDWINEVCQAYSFSRQTYYSAIDYFDRYLSSTNDISKKRIQLIGITCLFIASKMEEIFPPKIERFAFVCDGACSEEDIVLQELVILSKLDWEINPITPILWLGTYLQNYWCGNKENVKTACDGEQYLVPQYPTNLYVQIAHLIDLCVLHSRSLEFDYSVIAAAALYHFTCLEIVEQVTGKTLTELHSCIEWMIPFAYAIKNDGTDFVDKIDLDNYRAVDVQIHTVSCELLKNAEEIQNDLLRERAASLAESLESSESGIGSSTLASTSSFVSPRRSRL